MKLEDKDVVYDIYSNASPTRHMTITHIPTGISVKGSGQFQYRLRQDLAEKLQKKVTFKHLKDKYDVRRT